MRLRAREGQHSALHQRCGLCRPRMLRVDKLRHGHGVERLGVGRLPRVRNIHSGRYVLKGANERRCIGLREQPDRVAAHSIAHIHRLATSIHIVQCETEPLNQLQNAILVGPNVSTAHVDASAVLRLLGCSAAAESARRLEQRDAVAAAVIDQLQCT